nr:NAD-dependent epimerase/dehydratase family protein [Rhodococcus sp. BH4]
MKNYIVTGGTGFIGRNVLRTLVERDLEAIVHVLVREQSRRKLATMVAK